MRTKNTFLSAASAMLLLLNPFIVNAQSPWSAVRYDQHNTFHKVSAPTANTVFVTGIAPVTSQHFVLRTNDGGVNWDSISFNTATDTFLLTELYFVDASTGFVGGLKNGNQFLLKTTDNGNTWIPVTPNLSSQNPINSVFFINLSDGFATDGAFLYQTTSGGYSWVPLASPFTMRDVFFTDMNNGFACGDSASGGAAVVMQTSDGGLNWNTILTAYNPSWFASSFAKLDFINANVAYTALENSDRLYRTLDGGNSWQIIVVDSIDFIRDFDFKDPDNGHVLTELGWGQECRILISADGGQNCTMEYTTGWNFYGGGVVLNAFSFVEQTGYTTGSNGLVKKYSPSVTGINGEELNGTASVYPNPFSTCATVQITGWSELRMKHVELKVLDALGREVLRSEIRTPNFELKKSDLPNGIYFYRINNGNEILATGKLVVTD
jgi:photosystem II stability/assembly factor-like uncharacterized protein